MEAEGGYVKEIWLVSGWAMGWQVKTFVLYVVVSFPKPFKRRVKSHLPSAGIIRSSPFFHVSGLRVHRSMT